MPEQTVPSLAIGVFEDSDSAQRAVEALRQIGIADNQIGVVARDVNLRAKVEKSALDTPRAEGAAVGVAGGAGAGALWGLAVIANAVPPIGPVIAGGILSALFTSAVVGAATGGLAGYLGGWGVEASHANEFERDLQAGRILVAVRSEGRAQDANAVFQSSGSTRISSYPSASP